MAACSAGIFCKFHGSPDEDHHAWIPARTHTGSTKHLLGRTTIYRIIGFVGRWSMIDVFGLSILVALVQFAQFANFTAEIGSTCFAAVVVLTMFAVEFFDPRLMWDAQPASGNFVEDSAYAQPEGRYA